MGHSERDLIVRKYQRHDLVLPASISVAPEHQSVVRFSNGVCERDGWIEATLTDFSPGGLGFVVNLYLPRQCILRVRVFDLQEDGEAVLDVKARVQRVQMTDRRPSFLVGTSYADLTDAQAAAVSSLQAHMDAPGPESHGGAGDA